MQEAGAQRDPPRHRCWEVDACMGEGQAAPAPAAPAPAPAAGTWEAVGLSAAAAAAMAAGAAGAASMEVAEAAAAAVEVGAAAVAAAGGVRRRSDRPRPWRLWGRGGVRWGVIRARRLRLTLGKPVQVDIIKTRVESATGFSA